MRRIIRVAMWVVLVMAVAAGSAFAKTYECKSSTNPREIYLSYDVPCPPGRDANDLTPTQRVEKANDAAAARGEILVGMTKEQVLRVWGSPAKYGSSAEVSGGLIELWQYACPGTMNPFEYDRNNPTHIGKIVTLVFTNGKLSKHNRECAF